jgi:hypothetical protein
MRPFGPLAFVVAAATSVVGVAGCNEGSSAPGATGSPRAATTLTDLRQRPLHIEKLGAGESCPTARPRKLSPAFGPGLGDGPVYPLGFSERGVLRFAYPPPKNSLFAGSDWGGQKVLWVSDPKYGGPILIRGQQLDGSNQVRFGQGSAAILQELAFRRHSADNWSGGWRNFPSYTRLRSPGCYGYQVDGAGFTDIIVFRAAVWRS